MATMSEFVELQAENERLRKELDGANKTIAHFMGPDGEKHVDRFAALIASSSNEPAASQEPMAWARIFTDGRYEVTHGSWKWREPCELDPEPWTVVPLYSRPSSPPSEEHDPMKGMTSVQALEYLADEFSTAVDVTINATTFKAGVKVSTVLKAMRRHASLAGAASTKESE